MVFDNISSIWPSSPQARVYIRGGVLLGLVLSLGDVPQRGGHDDHLRPHGRPRPRPHLPPRHRFGRILFRAAASASNRWKISETKNKRTKKYARTKGISVCGSGVGAFVMAPLVRWLVNTYDWKVRKKKIKVSRVIKYWCKSDCSPRTLGHLPLLRTLRRIDKAPWGGCCSGNQARNLFYNFSFKYM